MASPAFLGFQNFPGGAPPPAQPPYKIQEEIHGQILDLIHLSNLCATPPPPPPLISSHRYKKLLIARHLI